MKLSLPLLHQIPLNHLLFEVRMPFDLLCKHFHVLQNFLLVAIQREAQKKPCPLKFMGKEAESNSKIDLFKIVPSFRQK